MENAILVHNVSAEDIEHRFTNLEKKLDKILQFRESQTKKEVYLTRAEVAEFLKCDLSTVHNWTKKGKLQSFGIGNRVYYKLADVEKALIPINSINSI